MEEKNLITIKVADEHDGERVDRVLSISIEEISRSYIQKIIEGGHVKINGTVSTSKKEQVEAGDIIQVEVPAVDQGKVEPEEIELEIVYEDDYVLVINKAKGMVVHPSAGHSEGTLVNAILHHCGTSLSSINGVVRPGIVHRIDKDTSGLLMVAKNDLAHRELAKQLEAHTITRGYKALVYNNFKEDEGVIDAPIGRDRFMRLRQSVTDVNSKNAVTHYKVLERLGRYTFIEAVLETGRTHQIRVHMAHTRHPLVGDDTYGPPKNPFGVKGQLLHAYKLGFKHPKTGEYMEFESPLTEEFQTVLNKMRGMM